MPCFRRVIEIVTHGSRARGCARVALEDDYHHFRVSLEYRNRFITRATGDALRTPYDLCRDATIGLGLLRGMALETDADVVLNHIDRRQQCTHMFDEAGLAVAAVTRNIRQRRYEIEVPRHVRGATRPRLWRDDDLLLDWQVEDGVIVSPAPFAAVNLGKGMARWALDNLGPDEAEAAIVLRRCSLISQGRLRNLDLESNASVTGRCFVQQPERAKRASRVKKSTLDFTNCKERLCAGDQSWLSESSLNCQAP